MATRADIDVGRRAAPMKLKDMDLSQAKTAGQIANAPRVLRYDLSRSDSFTNGFWDGRLWALARVWDMIPPEHRAEALARLDIRESETRHMGE